MRWIAVVVTWMGLSWHFQACTAEAPLRRVVILYDERTDLPGLADLDEGLTRTLELGNSGSIEIYREMMDLSRLGRDGYVEELRDHLAAKYRGKRVDVAVGVMGPALEFLLQHGSAAFPGARIVFCGIDSRELHGRTLPANVSGVIVERKFAPTLQLALSLHPDTERVVVVSGASQFDALLREQARAEFREYEDVVKIQYWPPAAIRELSTKLSQLPSRTLVLYTTIFRDGAGRPFVPHDAVQMLSAASAAPVYGFVDQYVGRGIVGGDVYSLNTHGEQAGRMVLRILDGDSQTSIESAGRARRQVVFDGRQLERWNIDRARLPAGAKVLFEPRSPWDEHRGLILAAIAIIGTQLALIIGLVVQSLRRRRAELKLRESESRFRSIANSAPVSIWMLDDSGRDEFFNDEWLRLVGGTQDSARRSGWMSRVHPDQSDDVKRRFAVAFDAKSRFDGEFRLRCAGDLYRWMFCTGVPRYDAAGAFVGYVCSATDIEERKQVEGAKADLAHAARLVAIGELTATLAHELKQPISAILTNVETAMMLMGSHSPSLSQLSSIVQDIRNDDLRAAAAIARIGTLVRKQELRFEAVDLRQVILEVLRFVASECHVHGVQARTELHDALPPVYADRVQLQQVFLNLIMNAIDAMKASPAGGRRLTISTRIVDATHAEIAIADTGTGIDSAHLPHVFESFFTTKKDGMGLGLRVVRSIVESHHGTIRVGNNSGPGATFRFTLPFAAALPDQAQRHSAAPEIAAGTHTRFGGRG